MTNTTGYSRYIEANKQLAQQNELRWDFTLDAEGNVPKHERWSISAMLNVPPTPAYYLSHLGTDVKCLRIRQGDNFLRSRVLSEPWQDLIKAATIEAAFIKKSSPAHIYGAIVRSLKVLATCCDEKDPWEINSTDVLHAAKVAGAIQTSGQLKQLVEGTAKTIFDANHISLFTPLLSAARSSRRNNKKTKDIRLELEERNRAERLPEAAAFWELVRILYEERPTSFFDAIRFEMIKLMVLLGLRGNEIATLPLDWRRTREYYDASGRRADENGGIGTSLQLRHFAEKQKSSDARGVLLSPNAIDVPPIFEEAIITALERVERLTAPLRKRLEIQIKTGRMLGEFQPSDFLDIYELYTCLTGEPFFRKDENEARITDEYFNALDPAIFHYIRSAQMALPSSCLKNKVRQYFGRLSAAANQHLKYRDVAPPYRLRPSAGFVSDSIMQVSDIEAIIQSAMPTKLSDVEPFNVEGGKQLEAYECMFLAPKRALTEGRNNGLCDLTRYLFVGRLTLGDIDYFISKDSSKGAPTIFERYGRTESDRQLSIRSHDLRHLMNTELFRQGIADTVITKRFSRKSVAQSYEYDHRSLLEDLERVSVPDNVSTLLYGKAEQVFKLIASGKAQGPIVRQFKDIQALEGDEAAVVFLAAEADGFHLTPYGGCINSFVAEPCPNHLECFNNCRHLMKMGLPKEDEALHTLLKRYERLLTSIDTHPAPLGAKANMRTHALQRVAAIQTTLNARPGELVFPLGQDNSKILNDIDRGPFRDA